jgi:hypothetical protein
MADEIVGVDVYANNIYFEASFWDLTIHFSQLDQRTNQSATRPKAMVTVPWTQAKLISYYIQVQLIVHEVQNGKIRIRPDLLPPPPELSQEEIEKDPTVLATVQKIAALRDAFVASLE